MAKKSVPAAVPASKPATNTGMAIVAYIVFFVPLLTDAKNDPFVKFHVKQGLVLFIAWVAVWVLSMLPVLGLLALPLYVVMLVFWIMGILNAVNGEMKPLPLIGQYADKFTL